MLKSLSIYANHTSSFIYQSALASKKLCQIKMLEYIFLNFSASVVVFVAWYNKFRVEIYWKVREDSEPRDRRKMWITKRMGILALNL